MADERYKRKLCAILSADVVGYSRLMSEDEAYTVRTITACRKIVTRIVRKHNGRVVDSPGDNIMAEFSSVVDAVQGAVEIQKEMKIKNEGLPAGRQMTFRIGLNLGDVIQDGKRIYGDGVNIAARLEALADNGGICISGSVYDQIENKLSLKHEYLGEHRVKNIKQPVRIYRILSKQATPSAEEDQAVLQNKTSVAVLPFTNMSADPEQEYFSDGITEEIITGLSKVPEMMVIARNSSFIYKKKPVKVQQVGKELGVRHVLEGSVRKAGDRIRITVQLIDAKDGRHLWADRYDRHLTDVFAVQDEITVNVMRALQVKLTEGEQACEWLKHGSEDIQAYEKGMKGMASFRRFTHAGNEEAKKYFTECIALDPKYPGAYVMLAWTHLIEVYNGWSKSAENSVHLAFAKAQEALALDELQADAHALLGNVYLFRKEFEKAIEEGERAIALNPNGADHHVWLAVILNAVGRPEKGVVLIKKALILNPFPPGWYFTTLGESYLILGRPEEAVEAYERALKETPGFLLALLGLTSAYAGLGHIQKAKATAARILEIDPTFSVHRFTEGVPYKRKKDRVLLSKNLQKAGLK